ncbi:MAG TPA: hypothetical protein VHA30_04705, partial [Patescibacteria group bacterium]|nr:hypothetical protein [Patescibacteria group bacterium]
TGLSWAGNTLNASNAFTGSGSNGYVTRWTGSSALGSGILLDNGTVAGVNATSSSYTFNLQADSGVSPFNIASSSGGSYLSVTSAGNVGIGTSTPVQPLQVAGNIGLGSAGNSRGALVFYNPSGSNTVSLQASTSLGSSYSLTLPTTTPTAGTALLTDAAGNLYWGSVSGGGGGATAIINYSKNLDTSNSGVTVTNTAAATTVYSYTVPANTLGTNKVLRLEIGGTLINNSGNARTVTLTLQYGGQTIVSQASGVFANNAAGGGWHATFYLMASSTSAQVGSFQADAQTGGSTQEWGASGTGTVDSTQSQNLVVQITLGTASTALTATKDIATLELVNASDTIQATLTGGTPDYVARWSGTSTLSTGLLIDNGAVAGVNATSSSYTFNIQGSSGVNPFRIASSSGSSLFTVAVNGSTTIASLGTGIVRSSSGSLYNGAIALGSADVSGILGIANGGTGISTAPTVSGQLLMASSTGWTVGSLVAGANITITTSTPGQIIIASTGGGSLSGGTSGYVARWTSSTTVSSGILLDNGTVAGVNATSSGVTFNLKAGAGATPLQVASSSGNILLAVDSGGNVGIGATSTVAGLEISGNNPLTKTGSVTGLASVNGMAVQGKYAYVVTA